MSYDRRMSTRLEYLLKGILHAIHPPPPPPPLRLWLEELNKSMPLLITHFSNVAMHALGTRQAGTDSASMHDALRAAVRDLNARFDKLEGVLDPTPPEVDDAVRNMVTHPAFVLGFKGIIASDMASPVLSVFIREASKWRPDKAPAKPVG